MSRSRLSPFAWWTLLTYSSAWAPNWRRAMSRLSGTNGALLLLGPRPARAPADSLPARPTRRLPARPPSGLPAAPLRDPAPPGRTPCGGAPGNATTKDAELPPRLLLAEAAPLPPPLARHQGLELADALLTNVAPRLE